MPKLSTLPHHSSRWSGLYRRHRQLLWLFAAVFLVYGLTLGHGFLQHDDDLHIAHNPRLQAMTPAGLAAFWLRPYLGLYIPVTYSYWALGSALSHVVEPEGIVPWAQPMLFHFGNLLLHALNAFLVYLLLRRYQAKELPALGGALVFALHPLQVEAVAWASGAKDLVATFFAFAALLAYAAFLRLNSGQGESKIRGARWSQLYRYLGALLLFTGAILAKPSTVVLPLFFLLQELIQSSRLRLVSLVRVLPAFLAVGLLLVFTGASQTPEGAFAPVPLALRPLVAGDTILFYLRQVLWPWYMGFAVDYGRRPELLLADQGRLLWSGLPYVVAAALAWLFWRGRYRFVAVAFGLFVLGVLPTLGLREFAYSFFSTVCDRYAYLSMLAVALAACGVLALLPVQRQVQVIALVAVYLGLTSLFLSATWQDEHALFSHSLAVQPEGAIALVGLANDLGNKNHWEETIPLLQRAVQAMPIWGRPYNNLGTSYLSLGRPVEAEQQYRRALQVYPTYALGHSNLCAALRSQKRYAEAQKECEEAVRLAPEFDLPELNLGFLSAALDDQPAALRHFQRVVRLAPQSFQGRLQMARTLRKLGRCPEALPHLHLLQEDHPRHQELLAELALCKAF